jgi:hypothetical protein
MAVTTKVPREQLVAYFDAFSKRFLQDGSPESADVELIGPDVGEQVVAQGARLRGITYDPRDNALEFSFELTVGEGADHRVIAPQEVWVNEDPDGFVSAINVVRLDGAHEVVTVRKVGLQRLE